MIIAAVKFVKNNNYNFFDLKAADSKLQMQRFAYSTVRPWRNNRLYTDRFLEYKRN